MIVPGRRRATGFSLVELMVALTLSLLLTAGALSMLYSTKLTSAENERVARIQEAGRTAFELIRQDARASGYAGCARPHTDSTGASFNTTGLSVTTLLWDFSKPVYGYEATAGTWSPVLDAAIPASPAPATGSDVLVLRTARPGWPLFRTNVAVTGGTADISVDKDPSVTTLTPPLQAPIPMVIGDCIRSEVFIATGWKPTGATATIQHGVGGTPVANNSGSLTNNHRQGALLQPVQTIIYYVASCGNTTAPCTGTTPPALWQIVGAGQPQELIQGVEAMQLKYGVDTNQDFLADKYLTADAVTAGNYWPNVVSVNIAILVRSVDQTGVETDKQTYSLLGTNFGPFNDRRHRSVFTTTITLRNDTT